MPPSNPPPSASSNSAEPQGPTKPWLEARLREALRLVDVDGTGHEAGGDVDFHHEINRGLEILEALEAHLGERLEGFAEAMGKDLPRTALDRLADIRLDRRPRALDSLSFDGVSRNPNTTDAMLQALWNRRSGQARGAAEQLSRRPRTGTDFSNDLLGILLHLGDPELREHAYGDALLQFRALWRSVGLMDQAEGTRDRTMGKIESSGIVSVEEARLVAGLRGAPNETARERCLQRLCLINHPHQNVGTIFFARNLIAALLDRLGWEFVSSEYIGTGRFAIPPYSAIHQQWSADSIAAIDHWIRHRVFCAGPVANRVELLNGLVRVAEDPRPNRSGVGLLMGRLNLACPWTADDDDAASAHAALDFLCGHSDYSRWSRFDNEERLEIFSLFRDLHRTMVAAIPSQEHLELVALRSGPAVKAVFEAAQLWGSSQPNTLLKWLSEGRHILVTAIDESESPEEVHRFLRCDGELERAEVAVLGTVWTHPQEYSDEGLREALGFALGSVERSELALLAPTGHPLPAWADFRQGLREGDLESRSLGPRVLDLSLSVIDGWEQVLAPRIRAVALAEVDVGLDPNFVDGLAKETGLHGAVALAAALTRRTDDVPATELGGVGVALRLFAGKGPVRFEGLRVFEDVEDLASRGVDAQKLSRTLVALRNFDERELRGDRAVPPIGGLVLLEEMAPAGLSHMVLWLKDQGRFGCLVRAEKWAALEGLSTEYSLCLGEDGCLRPSVPSDDAHPLPGKSFRGVYGVEIDGQLGNDGAATSLVRVPAPSFDAPDWTTLAELGAAEEAPALVGMKAAVLAAMGSGEAPAEGSIPPGLCLTVGGVRRLLSHSPWKGASLLDAWEESAAAIDGGVMGALDPAAVEASLVTALGESNPTPLGRTVLEEIRSHPEIGLRRRLVVRSSQLMEDLENWSGAGLRHSAVGPQGPQEVLGALARVIASHWSPSAVKACRDAGLLFAADWPAVLIQPMVAARVSGVAYSRGLHSEYGDVRYQAVRGGGGGVRGGPVEEGVVGRHETLVHRVAGPGRKFLSPEIASTLRFWTLFGERLLNTRFAADESFLRAADSEWAVGPGGFWLLQARFAA